MPLAERNAFHTILVVVATVLTACGASKTVSGPLPPDDPAWAPATRGYDPEVVAAAGQTNLVYILLDACRSQNLSAYGYERPTSPNMEALADRGVVFNRNYSQSPATLLSVPSYMTGRYMPIYSHDFGGWRELSRVPPLDEKLLPEIMRANGYQAVAFSSHPYFGEASRLWQSFDAYHYVTDSGGKYSGDFETVNAQALAWLEENHQEPFFLYVHVMDTHFPHTLESPYDKWLPEGVTPERQAVLQRANTNAGNLSPDEQEYLRGLYDGDILYSDDQIGRIMNKIEELGLADSTLFVIGSDHGDALGEDGRLVGHPITMTYDELLEVPWIMAGPGLPQGHRVDALSQNVDIVPTLVDIMDLDTSATFDGRSQLPALQHPLAPPVHDIIFYKARGESFDAQPTYGAFDGEHKFELNRGKVSMDRGYIAWQVPDSVATRERVELPRDVQERFKSFFETAIDPAWQAYLHAEQRTPPIFLEKLPNPVSGEFITHKDCTDNRWTLIGGRLTLCDQENETGPIDFELEIPNGTYEVQVQAGYPTAFVARVGEVDSFQAYTVTRDLPGHGIRRHLSLGSHTVDDGVLRVSFNKPGGGMPLDVMGIRFIDPEQVSDPSESTADQEEREDALNTLGYF
jgi:arylsulfatase A-like enzyme